MLPTLMSAPCLAILSTAIGAGLLPHAPSPSTGAAGVPAAPQLTWEFSPASLGCSALYLAAQPGGGSGMPQVSSLYRVDPNTGAETLVGSIGFHGVGGMTFGADGVLYATAASEDPPGSSPRSAILIRIDPTTGAGAFIGNIGSSANAGEVYRVLDLTTGPDGNVYGIGYETGETPLFRINTSTAVTTRIGSVVMNSVYPSALDFSPAGVLRGVLYDPVATPNVRLATIDPLTGAFTPGVVPTNVGTTDFAVAAEHCPFSGDFFFVERRYTPNTWRLVRCDPVSGVTSLNVPLPTGADAIAFDPNIVTYDVFLDTNNPPTTLVCDDGVAPTCDPGPLERCTTYFWRVTASVNGSPVEGPVWSFTTGFFSNADTNGDGVVDFLDLNNLLSDFGMGPNCPPQQ